MKRAFGILVGVLFALAAFFVGAYLWHGGDREVPATVTDDRSLPSLRVDDHLVHLEAFGRAEDPVLVVLHGGPGNDYRYLLPLSALSDSHRVVFYDQLGSGLSERVPDAQLNLENLLAELHQIIVHFSPDAPVRLVGHSWGAMLASAYLGRYPDRVSHAVLVEPSFLTPALFDQFLARFGAEASTLSWSVIKTTFAIAMQSLHVDGPDDDARSDYFFLQIATADFPEHPMRGLFCGGDFSTSSITGWRWGQRANTNATASLGEQGPVDFSAGLDRYPRKVLLIASSCNTVTGEDVQRQHAALFPNAEVVVVKNAGHTMIGERPEESLALIRTYLSEASPE